jgi:lipopolysaccharide/colanic/teichoic acid biosynthesis glycosyltransferase
MNTPRFRVYSVLADIIILALSYFLMTLLKPAGIREYVPSHAPFFVLLALLWMVVSILNGKIGKGNITNLRTLFYFVITSNLIATSIVALILYAFRDLGYSRTVVFGTALTATFLELFSGMIWLAFSKASIQEIDQIRPSERDMVARSHPENGNGIKHDPELTLRLQQGCSRERADALSSMVSRAEGSRLAVVSTAEAFNIQNLAPGDYSCIINLKPMNGINDIDAFLDTVNVRLTGDGIFLCSVETLEQRVSRLRHKFTPILYYLFIALPDFLIRRVAPRLRLTRGLWNFMTRGANAPLSRAEALGRLCRAGFAIKQEKFVGNMLCIRAQRKSAPLPVNGSGYGMIIALPRIGRDGNTFIVYKLRTMHPYSEFLQEYVYDLHDLQTGGKLKHDFRVTGWGSFSRRIWLDELPMIVNLFKGDMKIIGVRPLSHHYFNLYDEEIRNRRIKYKPGLIPPYYADMPAGLEQIQRSEIKYLDAWDKSHFGTDLRYFFKSIYNIIFRNARSN